MNEYDEEYQLDEWLADWELAQEEGRELSAEELCIAQPELVTRLRDRIEKLRATSWMLIDQASNNGVGADNATLSDSTDHSGSDVTTLAFISSVAKSRLLTDEQLSSVRSIAGEESESATALAATLIEKGLLTKYQTDVILNRGNGPLLLDRYTILDAIGSGGMGIVFKALHRSMERIVAIKVLPEFAVNSKDKIARFQREVKSVAKLSHPNVVAAFDAHENNGTYFLVMEYVDGKDLLELVDHDGPRTVDETISIIQQVSAALGAAHEQGMVHRDVKPTNIMLTNDGTTKLLDLGLARMMLITQSPSDPDLTKDGLGMGTASYMSPEQALDAKTADARSDIYSLGCTLYFLLTGKAPFVQNTTVQTIIAHREMRAPSLTDERNDVTPSLEAVYQRMVAKKPEDRFQNVNALRMALENIQPTFTPPALVEPIAVTRQPNVLSLRFRWLAAAVIAGAIVLGFAWWGRHGYLNQEDPILSRDIAKWAITSGGFATIKNELGEHALELTSDIPDGDFQVIGLDLYADTDNFSIEPAFKAPNLESLTLTDVSEIEVERIATLKSLTDLAFYYCSISDADLKALPSIENLVALSLVECDVTDDAMVYVAQLPRLIVLEVGGTEVTGEGLRLLHPLTQLRSLDLTGLPITADDLRSLPASIDDLSLPFCDVGDELVEVLKRFENLERLDLQGTLLTTSGIEALAALTKVKTLDLSDMRINADGLRALKGLPALESLTLIGVKLNEQKYVALSELDTLIELDLSGSNLDDEGLKYLAPMKNLDVLYLEGTRATETGIDRLQRARSDLTLYVDPNKV